jgi:hypothetical protein
MYSKLNGKTICLDLNSSIPYKQKKSIIDLLTSNGAKVSFILNKSVSLLIKNDRKNIDGYKCKTAFKLSIPVVHIDYIHELFNNEHVNLKEYLILDEEKDKNFKQGKIAKSNTTHKFI